MMWREVKQHYPQSHMGIKVLLVLKGTYQFQGKRRVLIFRPSPANGSIEDGNENSQKNICARFLYVISEVHESPEDHLHIFLKLHSSRNTQNVCIAICIQIKPAMTQQQITPHPSGLTQQKFISFLPRVHCESYLSVKATKCFPTDDSVIQADCLVGLSFQY